LSRCAFGSHFEDINQAEAFGQLTGARKADAVNAFPTLRPAALGKTGTNRVFSENPQRKMAAAGGAPRQGFGEYNPLV
jgi:hypothetical protein